tara:strand:+ start:138 stop:266 length:129 start_codon:yes stop_codon:yes gene_type:complete
MRLLRGVFLESSDFSSLFGFFICISILLGWGLLQKIIHEAGA